MKITLNIVKDDGTEIQATHDTPQAASDFLATLAPPPAEDEAKAD